MLTCQVNRDLSRRVKVTSTSVVWSRRAVESDVQLLAKLINHFDKKWHLWSYSVNNDEEREEREGEMEEGLKEPQQPKVIHVHVHIVFYSIQFYIVFVGESSFDWCN